MKLGALRFWNDLTPRAGAWNMALDEAMLEAASEPWLRVYRWCEPSVSIGFSQPVTVIPDSKKNWPAVRRWTGGGLVIHDGDWTYTLAIPPDHPVAGQAAPLTYRWIHEAMVSALTATGVAGCVLQPESISDGMGVCFAEPARYDVVYAGQKIAGAAQRRSRIGFLHQGTLQPLKVPESFPAIFAAELASGVTMVPHRDAESALAGRARVLVDEKYGSAAWFHERKVTEAAR